jgi:hypothetical protein
VWVEYRYPDVLTARRNLEAWSYRARKAAVPRTKRCQPSQAQPSSKTTRIIRLRVSQERNPPSVSDWRWMHITCHAIPARAIMMYPAIVMARALTSRTTPIRSVPAARTAPSQRPAMPPSAQRVLDGCREATRSWSSTSDGRGGETQSRRPAPRPRAVQSAPARARPRAMLTSPTLTAARVTAGWNGISTPAPPPQPRVRQQPHPSAR